MATIILSVDKHTYTEEIQIRYPYPEIHLIEKVSFKDWDEQNKIIQQFNTFYRCTAKETFKSLTRIGEIE